MNIIFYVVLFLTHVIESFTSTSNNNLFAVNLTMQVNNYVGNVFNFIE